MRDPPRPKEVVVPPRPKEKLRLRGNPNDVIDLFGDFTSSKMKTEEDVEALKSRFMRHSLGGKPKASPVSVSLKSVKTVSGTSC